MFGGKITGGLIGGILKVHNDGNGNISVVDPFDTTTEVTDRILFFGVEGGFEFSGVGGFTIRFALSELLPGRLYQCGHTWGYPHRPSLHTDLHQ